MSMTKDYMSKMDEDDEDAVEAASGRDVITIAVVDALRVTHALRLCDAALRAELDGDVPVVYNPEELTALVDQIDDCFDLLCCRLEARGMHPPA
jgi:hypothetical protein